MSTYDEQHDRLRELLGAHALGQLSAAEAAEVDDHLAGCADCRGERDEIMPAASALADLRLAARSDGRVESPVPPEDLGGRVLALVDDDARRTDRSRWLRAAGLAGVAAAVASVVLVTGIRLTQPDPAPKGPLEAVTVVESTRAVTASAAIVPHTWGVEVKLHARGFVRGERYVVTVQGTDGKSHAAGEFVGTGAREMDCNLNSSVLRNRAAGFEVRDPAGTVLVSSRF